MRQRHEIHVERFEAGRNHVPTLACWCGPVAIGRDLDSSKAVVRHRTPPRPSLNSYSRQAAADFAAYDDDDA